MKKGFVKKALSIFLTVAILLSSLPLMSVPATAASVNAVADPGTAHTWESMMGTNADGNRYAGRIWVDKSVYTDGQTALLNTSGQDGSAFKVALEEGESFQTIFSALGSSMATTTSTSSTGPMDVVLVIDVSPSMAYISTDKKNSRLYHTINAANALLEDLSEIKNIRIGIATYNVDSEVLLDLDFYTNGVILSVNDYRDNGKGGVITAKDSTGKVISNRHSGYYSYTNLQSGIDEGFNMLANAQNTTGRKPVAIVLTDGEANVAVNNNWYDLDNADKYATGGITQGLTLSTLLNAAYNKTKIEKIYGTEATVYGIGVDLDKDGKAQVLMNPASQTNGFNSNNDSNTIKSAYNLFVNTWAKGNTVSFYERGDKWTFDHKYPTTDGITRTDIVDNINYVDKYYDVSSTGLADTFKQIYKEMASVAFNPITSSVTTDGATGVQNTPLIYVDNIGKYMEVKNIQAVTLFGSSYNVTKNADGTYTVASADGINPTTNEEYNTSEDIKIAITENDDGTQKLEIRINQEVLPIILEQVVSKTVGDETNATINEFTYNPLRVYYTVGIDSDILLESGDIDITKIDSGYEYIDDDKGEITFFSNAFGGFNTEDADENGLVDYGDAHVGFKPASENRYYYHQSNQGIFTKITSKADGSTVDITENNEYGIVWDESKYNLNWMTYDEYLSTKGDDMVYTYVSYYHPTPSSSDAANAAEKVTYLVYTDWKYLKESAAFYDATSQKYVNYDAATGSYSLDDKGYVMSADAIAAYVADNAAAKIYAVLGVGSHRTSRFHNMTFQKSENNTETADYRYVPQYTEEIASVHNGNDVVVWLGNNGRLTVPVATGIALSKSVTEAIGNANDTYALTVTVPSGVTALPVVKDANGNDVTAAISTYSDNVLTVNLKAGETVYVSGIPAGTECIVGESVPADAEYSMVGEAQKVTIPTLTDVIDGVSDQYVAATITNRPHKYGNLYITKELSSDHTIPESILNEEFAIEVDLGEAFANEAITVGDSEATAAYTVTADENGVLSFNIKARQTVELLNLPENTAATVTEILTAEQKKIFTGVTYRTRNHSGEDADNDGSVIIPAGANATAVVINTYKPLSTTVDMDVVINKSFADESVKSKLAGGEFTFSVQEYNSDTKEWDDIATDKIAYAAEEYGQKSITIADVLKTEEYTRTGTYAYQVLEVKGNVTNVSYDRTLYTFNVNVTDNGGQLVATVTDLLGNEIENTVGDSAIDYVTKFNNTYETAPISMDIAKVVNNLSGDPEVSKAGFKFRSINVDANGNPLAPNQPETATNTIISDASGEARISGVYTKEQLGTHYYLVYEEDGGKAGWTYSKAQYLVTVVVAENAETGKLSATMTITPFNDAARAEAAPTVAENNKGKLYFTNTYDPADETLDVDALANKALTGKALKGGDFTFNVYENGKTTAILTGTNDANGKINFKAADQSLALTKNDVLNFTKVGKYEFDIKEAIPEGAVYNADTDTYVLNGVTYDSTIYDLVVEVENDPSTGKLKATYYFEDSTATTVTFKNYYSVAATDYTISGLKTLSGRAIGAGEFSFALYEGDTHIETVTNKADGSFSFTKITYDTADEHIYTLKELLPDGTDKASGKNSVNGITYDLDEYKITVTVTDNGDGTLSASADVENSEIKFENSYKAAPATVSFSGNKVYKGAELSENLFAFVLYETDFHLNVGAANTTVVGTEYNDAEGDFAFDAITYSAPGTYFYVIAEDATYSTIDDVVYDTTLHTFRVQVRDAGTGQLTAVITDLDSGVDTDPAASVSAEVSFTNATFDEATGKEVEKAEGGVTTKIDGSVVEAGDILTYYIYYYNYTGKDAVVEINDAIPAHTSYVEGSASHNGSYASGHIEWFLNVEKGKSVTVSFSVEVNETDAIVANTATILDGTNTYHTNTVHNHTYDNPASKDVYSPNDVDASIDGKKVYSGDTLIYEVSYTNTSYDTVDVTVTDTIPANTTYVADSADNGGVYEGGKITWNIEEVKPWTTVTVAFMVTVNDDIGAATIANKADIKVGENTYTTNEVQSHTVKDEVGKKAYFENTNVNIDGKKVYAGDTLVYEISYKNTDTEAADVTITDSIPQHTTYVADSADNGGVYENGKLTWNLEVPAGETVTVSFKVTVDDVRAVNLSNSAKIVEGKNEYTTNTVGLYTVKDEVEKLVLSPENLNINIDGKKVYEGDTLIYKINYKNTDTTAPATVTITDSIPVNTTYVADSADNGGLYKDGKVIWSITVPAGETKAVSFKVTVNANIGVAEISNTATAVEGRNTYETNKVQNHTVKDEVSKKAYFADDTTANIDGKKVYAGDELVYKISYKNTDTAAAKVTITDTIPAHTTYVADSADNGGAYADGKLTWNLEVPAGNTVTVSFKVKVNDDVVAENLANTAEVKEGKNTYKTNSVANYTVDDDVKKDVFFENAPDVSVDGKKVYAGDTLVYNISYRNTADESADVVITDTIPQYTSYVEGSADNGGVYADGKLTWNLEVLAGETVTVSFKVTVNSDIGAAGISNTAEIKEGKNTYETNGTVNSTSKDEVSKNVFNAENPTISIDGQEISVGDTLIYEITYKNNYDKAATVDITDIIPEYTTYVEGSADNGGVYADGKLTWNLEVPAGETVTVSFKVTVNNEEGAQITNTATVVEGRNTYTTNGVSTTTSVVPPVVPENPPVEDDNTPSDEAPDTDSTPDIDNPETGDSTNLTLLLALCFVSGGIFAGALLLGKKKRTN